MKTITARDLYLLSVLGLIQGAGLVLPVQVRRFFVKAVAFIAYRVSGTKRRLSKKNLSQAFGGKLSKEHIRRIVKSSFYQFWLEAFSISADSTGETSLRGTETRGLEHLQRALDKGTGVILWESSHLGRRLLAKQILHGHGFAINQVHGENHLGGFASGRGPSSWTRQHLIRRFFENCERPFVRDIIYVTSSGSLAYTKILLERLNRNSIVCISADSRRGQKLIPVSFLGHTDFFPTGMVSLAKLSGATVLPLFCLYENRDRLTLIIERPLCVSDSVRGNGVDSVGQYVSLLQSYVQKYPEQYWDWHELAMSQQGRAEDQVKGYGPMLTW